MNPTLKRQKEAVALDKHSTQLDTIILYQKQIIFKWSDVDSNRVVVVVNQLITDHISYAEYVSIKKLVGICTLPII